MSIEDFNKAIIQGMPVKIERNETVRGHIDWSIIARLKEYWEQNGYPTEQDYINHLQKLKLQK